MERSQLQLKPKSLLSQIKSLDPWIEGTLVATARKCGKKTCACHRGGPRHPAFFITWKEAGKTVSLYVPRALEPKVREWSQNFRKLKALIRQASDIQKELIRLRE